ncbi:MAG TPA: ion transporter [Nitrososphaeraceae archaeon]|nr:ion transporter [Nitrososphaeraceae archaeon]
MLEYNKLINNNTLKILFSSLIIASVLILFIDLLYPLGEDQRIALRIFDLAVVALLGLDFLARLKSSQSRSHFILRHLYEFPALIPLLVTGAVDSSSFLFYIRLIALFRVVRLYNIMQYVEGSELVILASMSVVSVLFGGFAIYIVEAGQPDSSINNIPDAIWWSIETITTVAYGEYYPVTYEGRLIATIMMITAIAFLWTFVGLLGSRFVAKRITKKEKEKEDRDKDKDEDKYVGSSTNNSYKPTSVVHETKLMVKKRIDEIETMGKDDLEALITIIRSLNGNTKFSEKIG